MTRANREAHCGRRRSPGNAAPTTSSTANGSSTAYREFFAICGLAGAAGRGGEGAHRHDQAPGALARNREIRCRRSDLDREIRCRRFSRISRRRRTHIGLGVSRDKKLFYYFYLHIIFLLSYLFLLFFILQLCILFVTYKVKEHGI